MGEAPAQYKDGDVVWVKLGPAWWPGQVTDPTGVPEEILSNLKRPPLVIVKFFEEETYEYVKNWGHVYPYNCEKKNEFIKKGMASFRKAAHMGKFPKDVSLAEVKTGGNANILSDPMFLPEQKRNSLSPSPKKRPKLFLGGPSTSRPVDTSHITHRRFLGFDDYEAFVCIQYPGKDKDGDSEDEEVRNINNEPEEDYNCHSCPFKTRRLEIMIRHTRSHVQGNYSESSKVRRHKNSSSKRQKKQKRLVTGEDSLSDTEESDRELSSSVDVTKEKRPPKSYARKPKVVYEIIESESDEETEEKRQPAKKEDNMTDIRTNLLAEWEDSDEESEKAEENEEKEETTKDQLKSCFDFDEDDEEIAAPSTAGRKIPRVIPEKRKSQEEPEDLNKEAILKESESFNREETPKEVDLDFESLMESTAVPDLPEIQNTLKPEQNFHDTNTVKFPDKEDDPKKESEVATKLTNPKKRFVKSFEDFELEMRRKEEQENAAKNGKIQEEVSSILEDCEEVKSLEEVSSITEETEASKVEETQEETELKVSEESDESLFSKLTEDIAENAEEDSSKNIEDPAAIPEESVEEIAKEISTIIGRTEEKPQPVEETEEVKSEEAQKSTTEDLPKEDSEPPRVEERSEEPPREEDTAVPVQEEETKVEETIQKHPKFRSKRLREGRKKSLEEPPKNKETEPVIEETPIDEPPRRKRGRLSVEEESNEPPKLEESPVLETPKRRRGRPPKKDKRILISEEVQAQPVVTEDKTNSVVDSEKTAISEDIAPLKKRIRSISSQNEETSVEAPPVEVKKEEPKLITPPKKKRRHRSFREESSEESTVVTPSVPAVEEIAVVPQEKIQITEEISSESNQQVSEVSKDSQLEVCEEAPRVEEQVSEEIPLGEKEETRQEVVEEKVAEVKKPEECAEEAQVVEEKEKSQVKAEEIQPVVEETQVLMEETSVLEEKPQVVEEKIQFFEDMGPICVEDIPLPPGDPPPNMGGPSFFLERTAPAVEETPPIVKETPALVKETPAVVEETPAVVEETPVVVEETPVVVEQTPVIEETAAVVEETPAVVEEIPAVVEETPAIVKETPAVVEETPAVVEEVSGVVEETPAVVEETPMIVEETSVTVEEKPEDIEETPAVVQEKPAVIEKIPVDVKETSGDVKETTAVVEEMPAVEETPAVVEETTVVEETNVVEETTAIEEPPVVLEETPVVEETTVIEELPVVEEETPVVEETTVVEETAVIEEPQEIPLVIKETPVTSEEVAPQIEDVAPKEETVEEAQVIPEQVVVEDMPVVCEETVEETPVVAEEIEAKKEEPTSAEECTQQSSDMNEEVSSMDSFKDEFSSIGKASLELPEDAIWTPPKKKNKRGKTPEDNMMDMFFNFDKKPLKRNKEEKIEEETKEIVETETVKKEETPVSNGPNEGETPESSKVAVVKVGNNGEEEDFKFCIQTNLTNFSKAEEMSALTLAALSEIQEEKKIEDKVEEPKKIEEVSGVLLPIPESELVQIEGNLTVVSEKDLAEGQVEITTEKVISPKKSKENKETTKIGTEIPEKAMTVLFEKPSVEKIQKKHAYGRLELLDILEGNSNSNSSSSEQTFKDSYNAYEKKDFVQGICDFEECIPSQIVRATKSDNKPVIEEQKIEVKKGKARIISSKLLEKLNEPKVVVTKPRITIQSDVKVTEGIVKHMATSAPKTTVIKSQSKFIIKTTKPAVSTGSKPIILSEQIIKPASDVQKIKANKRSLNDIEDVKAFVIHKGPKMVVDASKQLKSKCGMGKAKILNQTIITPQGEIIQPNTNQTSVDDNIFDINSMPIVLSDEILTPESIEKMPIVLEAEQPGRSQQNVTTTELQNKNVISVNPKGQKRPRLLQGATKMIKTSPLVPLPAKSGKYIIIPSTHSTTLTQNKVLTPKTVVKRTAPNKLLNLTPTSEPIGNKIMIVTNQQGQQQRLLLTPAQQKLLQLQSQATKPLGAAKTVVKTQKAAAGDEAQPPKPKTTVKQVVTLTKAPEAGPSGLPKTTGVSTVAKTVGAKTAVVKAVAPKKIGQKTYVPKTQKTILIKNQHGETVRRIQGTDDAELDKQVAEQLEAIKASARLSAQNKGIQQEVPQKVTRPAPIRKTGFIKKNTVQTQSNDAVKMKKADTQAPPLAPISQKKAEVPTSVQTTTAEPKTTSAPVVSTAEQKLGRPLNQLVIQDAMGVQTTITEGQIVAFPSETVDGQPQSYMLVTLDEHGNLTPLNNEALMSLDPSLGLGVDLNNMVLQIDQGQGALAIVNPDSTLKKPSDLLKHDPEPEKCVVKETDKQPAVVTTETVVQQAIVSESAMPGGQQLILTGDPVATQKFLESLSDGNTDLANILANADAGNIIIHADGQQILINTNADGSLLTNEVREENDGNPVFATKSQDILAAALADTDVFQPESQPGKSQLSPNSGLYPMNVGNVLETSLTLSSPIMTPLEVPSTNSKKIDDEADILSQVPKNVDLPITITDPNISQTVAQQQAVSLIANELQNNLELNLAISETTTTSEIVTPYVYSLPTLNENVDLNQKPFNNSMPLLTDDEEKTEKKLDETRSKTGRFIDEGLCTLGGEMCSSLSEPPPDMFDLAGVSSEFKKAGSVEKDDEASSDLSSAQGETSSVNSSEGSCEIPIQPRIVAKLSELDGPTKKFD